MNNNFRNNNFDLIRLIAAMQVMYHHATTHFGINELPWLTWVKYFPGVPIFFVTSGFLISASYKKNSNLRIYFFNRFIRIYPALWVCFIFSLGSLIILNDLTVDMGVILPWITAQLTIGQFYNPEFLRDYGVGVLNGSLWTIPVELQFYIALPLIYSVLEFFKWNRALIISIMALFIVINQYYFYTSYSNEDQSLIAKLFGVSLAPYLFMFFVGMLLQKYIGILIKFLRNKFHYILIIYISSLVLTNWLSLPNDGNFMNPLSAIILGILTISMAYSYTEKLSGITKGYDISYGIYIYHMVFINVLVEHSHLSQETSLLLSFILTLTAATLSWAYIEKPCLRKKSVTNRYK